MAKEEIFRLIGQNLNGTEVEYYRDSPWSSHFKQAYNIRKTEYASRIYYRESIDMKYLHILMLGLFLLPVTSGCSNSGEEELPVVEVTDDGSTSVNENNLGEQLETMPTGELSQLEIDGLLYMREEEKLAHDVYSKLYESSGQKIFTNIASAESTHTDAILQLLNRYGLEDPAEGNAVGVFTNPDLQALNDILVADGSASLIDALMVGAAIEEIDMLDIQFYIDQLEGNDDIEMVYESLLKGSRNHLRSFVSNLEKQGIVYIPQYMDQADYDDIIDSPMEQG